jgi:hypothetical protein
VNYYFLLTKGQRERADHCGYVRLMDVVRTGRLPVGKSRTDASELMGLEPGGMLHTASARRYEEGGLAASSVNTTKNGTCAGVNARDAAVAASLLLQHMCHVDTLRKALTCNGDGSASGPLVGALDLLSVQGG